MYLGFLLLLCWSLLASAGFVSYPRPSIYEKSDEYSLKVNGTYMYTVNYYEVYDYVQLSMDEGHETEFRIAAPGESSISSYSISPKNLNIKATTSGNELIFSVTKAHYLIVTINDLKKFVIVADKTETDVPPSSGSGIYNVMDYGADNTGASLTTGIQDAMDAATKTPGSTVYVPPGLYDMPNLLLRNQTNLYLAGGAVLHFTGNRADYNLTYNVTDVGAGTWWIHTDPGTTGIKVYGRGTIDGNGYYSLNGGADMVAMLLVPAGTSNFQFDGPLLRDGSFWTVVPIQSDNVSIKNIKILNRRDIGQNDGIDACESTNVSVTHAIAISNDDSFSSKTWPYMTGTTVPYPYPPRALSNVVFDDCFSWTLCFSFKIGQGVYESQSNITFKNGVTYQAGVSLGIHHKYGNSTASGITFDNIDIESLAGAPAGKASWFAGFIENVNMGVGAVQDVTVSNIRARVQGSKGAVLEGYNSSILMSHVRFNNIYMYANTTPATTLEEMNIQYTLHSSDVAIVNS